LFVVHADSQISLSAKLIAVAAAICGVAISAAAPAQSEGDVYVAGNGFSFQQAAEQGISRTSGGQRFFLLVLPPETDALTTTAAGPLVTLRDRVVASNGVLYVCQRDIDSGKISVSSLVPGVVKVRGWPPVGGGGLPEGEKFYPDENPANFPVSTNSMRLLRSACSS
jgi:hypothetical protein